MEPPHADWSLDDRRRALSYLEVFADPGFKSCTWIVPEPREENGKIIHSLGWPEYDPRVDAFLSLAWTVPDSNPYEGEPWEAFWLRYCASPDAFASASVEDVRRYLMLVRRRERFGDGTIESAFENGTILAALRRLGELTPK